MIRDAPELTADVLRTGQAARLLRRPDRRPAAPAARTWSAGSAGRSASGRSTRPSTPARRSSRPGRRTTTAPTTTRPRSQPRTKPAVLILGSGPNRIGQGIEFDYSCVHAAMALSRRPATRRSWSTATPRPSPPTTTPPTGSTSSRSRWRTCSRWCTPSRPPGPVAGVIVQLGGQTPLRLAQALKDAGVPIVGTSPEAIHLAEERGAFGQVLAEADLPAPKHGLARSFERGQEDRRRDRLPGAGPALVRARRPRAWRSSTTRARCPSYIDRATEVSPAHPVLVDRFLDDAVEIDVDALYDGIELYLGGVMEHIEEAGIHSGDSACALPPITLGRRGGRPDPRLDRGDRRRGRASAA